MVRPKPVPVRLVVKNGSNRWARASAEKPAPVSAISSCTPRSSALVRKRRVWGRRWGAASSGSPKDAGSMASSAFLQRLIKMVCTFCASQRNQSGAPPSSSSR